MKSSKDTLVLVTTQEPGDTYIDGSGGLSNPLWYDLWDTTPKGDHFGELAWYLPNPHFDDLANQAETEIIRALAYPLWAEMQSILSEDLLTIRLFVRGKIEAHNPNLVNWETGTLGRSAYNAQAMYFK